MKDRLLFFILFFILWNTLCLSQTWIDSIRTIYSSSLKVHHPTFMKPILPYYAGYRTTLMVVEDSGTVSLFKVASFNSYNSDIPSFHTILTRSSLIGKAQFIGFYNDKDSLYQQFLFWEEGSGAEQRIMYSHCGLDSTWEAPRYFFPSLYRQHEIICSQTNISAYPRQYTFAVGWNEQDSLTVVNFLSDSIISKIRIASNDLTDSVHPALSDGMIVWETHNSSSLLRYTTFSTSGSIISTDTITGSQYASHPVFLFSFGGYMPHYLCWMKTINGIGNIIGSSYNDDTSPQWESPSAVTNDSTGKNLPIIASLAMHIPIYKTFQSLYFYYHYLVFIRTLNDSNAFVRVNNRNFDSRREYWTKNQIIEIDAQPGDIVYSAWVESDSSLYTVFYHAGRAYPDAVKDDPPIPSRFSLEQNYPNPFNPSTTIQYSIPSSGLVTLEIFDILGRKIITLINNSRQSSGTHQLQCDANEFPSGIYFYRLKCNTTVITKKMLLIR